VVAEALAPFHPAEFSRNLRLQKIFMKGDVLECNEVHWTNFGQIVAEQIQDLRCSLLCFEAASSLKINLS
jgi:hypothetical protein